MSRIGQQPIVCPNEVDVTVADSTVHIKGPRGSHVLRVSPKMTIQKKDNVLLVQRQDDMKETRALHGMTRAIIANMVRGVLTGWERVLKLSGVGYRAAVEGGTLHLHVGFSHPVVLTPPPGVTVAVRENTITVSGSDKALVGQMAANIRAVRPPEPYKGKGIRYQHEHIRRKVGKTAAGEGVVGKGAAGS